MAVNTRGFAFSPAQPGTLALAKLTPQNYVDGQSFASSGAFNWDIPKLETGASTILNAMQDIGSNILSGVKIRVADVNAQKDRDARVEAAGLERQWESEKLDRTLAAKDEMTPYQQAMVTLAETRLEDGKNKNNPTSAVVYPDGTEPEPEVEALPVVPAARRTLPVNSSGALAATKIVEPDGLPVKEEEAAIGLNLAENAPPAPNATPQTIGGASADQKFITEKGVDESYNTILTPAEEAGFATWKAKYAPNDSGDDYDLRGAYKAGMTPENDHWDDQYKKPNHPTFSTFSNYAIGNNLAKAGTWEGDKFIPPKNQAAVDEPSVVLNGQPALASAKLGSSAPTTTSSPDLSKTTTTGPAAPPAAPAAPTWKDYVAKNPHTKVVPTTIPGRVWAQRPDGEFQMVEVNPEEYMGVERKIPEGYEVKRINEDEKGNLRKQLEKKTPAGQYTEDQRKAINTLSDNYRQDQYIKSASTIKVQHPVVIAALKDMTGLSDIAAINAFQKIVDPGVATREGDVALIQSAVPWIGQLDLQMKRVANGEKLTPEMRKQMSNAATLLKDAYIPLAKQSAGKFKKLATKYGVDYDDFGEDFDEKAAKSEVDATSLIDQIKAAKEGTPERKALLDQYRALRLKEKGGQ